MIDETNSYRLEQYGKVTFYTTPDEVWDNIQWGPYLVYYGDTDKIVEEFLIY